MKKIRFCAVLLTVLVTACLLVSCVREEAPGSSDGSEETRSAESVSSMEETVDESSDEEGSLPASEAIVLLYTDYLTVHAEQDGIAYEYTYCFDAEQCVFNAIAVICFPTQAEAKKEYLWLLERGYPNLRVDGSSLTFCFPRRECPFYGISYRSLELLLAEETVYEIVDSHPPAQNENSENSSEA